MSILLIGNSPSSGSTFLADILDSTQFTACGPEVGIFTDSSAYKIGTDEWSGWGSECSCIYSSRAAPNFGRLHNYGLNKSELLDMQSSSSNFNDFSEKFCERYRALRGKDSNAVVFEKTPKNISCLGEYLNSSAGGYFIFLVRNPVYVYLSLLKRGFDPYIAAATWLVDAAKYFKHANDERVILVKYEDLVSKPFQIVSQLIGRVSGVTVDPSELEWGYKNNSYRKHTSKKLDSWSINAHGKVGDANTRQIPDSVKTQLEAFGALRIREEYCRHFDICDINYRFALDLFGYSDQAVGHISETRSVSTYNRYKFNPSGTEKYLLARKLFNSYRFRNKNIDPLGLSCAMKPVV